MALILNIDTATVTGSVCLARDGKVLETAINEQQQDHAAQLTNMITALMQRHAVTSSMLDAVAVSAGPGSYTGLRVGVATAKGLCYAWNKPLIAVPTLQMMAQGALEHTGDSNALYCPMLDARRQEVFTAVYDNRLQEVLAPQAMVLEPDAFGQWLPDNKIYFLGDGSAKWEQLMHPHAHAVFIPYRMNAEHMIPLSDAAFSRNDFADIAYFSPFYLKPVHFQRKA